MRLDAATAGFVPTAHREVPRYEGKMRPPVPREESVDPAPAPESRKGLFGRRR